MEPRNYVDRVKAMPQKLKGRLIKAFPDIEDLREKLETAGGLNLDFILKNKTDNEWLCPEDALDFIEDGNIDGIKDAAKKYITRRKLRNEVYNWLNM